MSTQTGDRSDVDKALCAGHADSAAKPPPKVDSPRVEAEITRLQYLLAFSTTARVNNTAAGGDATTKGN